MANLNALAPVADINHYVQLANNTKNLVNPEVFYSKQLLDTIRIDAKEYKYFKLADESPIQDKADKLVLRRWAPLQAHTVPLVEGVPPKSDKGSVEKYELQADQYGRYMEFTDKVDFKVVDPVLAHYSREYSIVAIETLDLLAREALALVANKFYAGVSADVESMTIANAKPTLTDLRLIALHFKRTLVKPRRGQNYVVICSPEFTYDMVEDPTVEKFMKINNTTKNLYDGSVLFPMFNLEFEESLAVPASGDFDVIVSGSAVKAKRLVRSDGNGGYQYYTLKATDKVTKNGAQVDAMQIAEDGAYVQDSRTGQDASFIPNLETWNIEGCTINQHDDWSELKIHHIYVLGKDALTRTGLTGQGQARMYTKPLGSAGVLDPIDQRQSIGFKINSVGFGSTRGEAVVDYMCIPSTANLVWGE